MKIKAEIQSFIDRSYDCYSSCRGHDGRSMSRIQYEHGIFASIGRCAASDSTVDASFLVLHEYQFQCLMLMKRTGHKLRPPADLRRVA